jgi:hypothetical protein
VSHTRDIPKPSGATNSCPGWNCAAPDKAARPINGTAIRSSLGAIIEGETCCLCNGQEYLLRPGDLIIIPAQAPHSCNPRDGRPRSYHMLYLDMTWCRQQLPLLPSQAQMNAPHPVIRDPELFARYQQIVTLMDRQQTAALPEQIAQLLRRSRSAPPRHYRCARPVHSFSVAWRPIYGAAVAGCAGPRVRAAQRDADPRLEAGYRPDPASFINMARIEFAKTRLRAGDEIADVGYQAGFADQSHFHKTFVSYTAATPRQYAQRSISDNN